MPLLNATRERAASGTEADIGHRLLAAVARLGPGSILSVSRPQTAFQAALTLLGRSPSDILAHATAAVLRSRSPWISPRSALSDTRYLSQIVDERAGRLLLASGDMVESGPIDRLYGTLKDCVALEIGGEGDLSPLLAGAMALIRRCRPLLALDLDGQPKRLLRDVLARAGYVAPELQPVPGEPDGGATSGLLLVTPAAEEGAPSSAPSLRRPALGPMLAALRLEAASDPFGSWQCYVRARELIMSEAMPVDHYRGTDVRWTGPGPETGLRLWVPARGTYSFTLDVAEYDDPIENGPGMLRHAFGAKASAEEGHAVELTTTVSEEEARSGVLISHVLPSLKHRFVMGRVCKVGVPVKGLRIERVDDNRDFQCSIRSRP